MHSIPRFTFSYSHCNGAFFSFSAKKSERVFLLEDFRVLNSTVTKASDPPLEYLQTCSINELEFYFCMGKEIKRIKRMKLLDQSNLALDFGCIRILIRRKGDRLVFESAELDLRVVEQSN
jgi:hypothetical protein